MNSVVRISSTIGKLGINPSANLCKISFPYTKKSFLANLNNNRNSEYKSYTQTNLENESEKKTSQSWNINKDGGHFNKGFGIAGIATAISVSAILYYKYQKGVKAESGKKYFSV